MPVALIPYPHISPVIFHIGPLAIRWYGLAYLLGFLLSYMILRRMIRRGTLRISRQSLDDLLSWLALGVIFGGRLGWWIFYHHNIHEQEPWYEPIAIWHGGMSFHGGLLGVALVLFIFSRKRRLPAWNIADCAALVTPIGLFLGRLGNFVNGELFGRPSTVPWAMIFPGETIPRHPSQLYEALLEGPTIMAILWLIRRAHPRDGQIAAAFLIFYGCFRFLVEFTREPDPQLGFIAFGWLTMGQILSAVIVLIGVILWLSRRRVSPKI